MRVVYISPFPPQRDGIGDYTAALAHETRAAGHEVAVIVPRAVAPVANPVIGGLGAVRALGAHLRALDPDVIHVQFAVAAFAGRIPALLRLLADVRSLRARVVVTAHEVTRDTALLRGSGRALYRLLLARSDRVLVHTASAREELVGRMGARPASVLVVPHHRRPPPAATTDAAMLRARHGIAPGEAVLLAFGFVHVDKGLGDLVTALGRLERGVAHLVVAGAIRRRTGVFRAFEIPDRRHLARMARSVDRLGLDGQVHFTGYVPAGEVAPWFDAADAAVLPYRRIEQSGVGSLAAALGVPVLTSTAGSLTDDFGLAQWSFPPADPVSLARVLGDFLAAPRPARAAARASTGADIAAVCAATLAAYGLPSSRPTSGRDPVPTA